MNYENVKLCPICGNAKRIYLFKFHGLSITRCDECNLAFSSPNEVLKDDAFFAIRDHKIASSASLAGKNTEVEACKNYLKSLLKRSPNIKNIAVIASEGHYFSVAARDFGLNVVCSVSVDEFENGLDINEVVDSVVIIYQLEKCASLEKILDKAYTLLKSGGELFIVTLSLDSHSANFFRQSWTGWRPENRFYFDNTNIQLVLWRYGFQDVWVESDVRPYTLAHINERASAFPSTWVTRMIRGMYKILPTSLHNRYFRLPSSGMIVMSRKKERHVLPVLSVVLPVYNEDVTFSVLMDQLLDLNLPDIQKEIIVVESNSKDNSREMVMQYKDRPEVKIILQEKALGKGNAVRAGFENATGDVVLIQDADLEYDLNDYETLIEPVVSYKKPFVLGARRGGEWKMRHFVEQQQLSAYLNFGHVLFAALLNILYGQRLKDPFTMYKIFHRDCLYNLKFECNRFDFDFELVIKLIRKGYTPMEIPANYNSRSFAEGKKVNMFRDPLTWIRALLKYRFAKITKE
jgi:hypothetical protein